MAVDCIENLANNFEIISTELQRSSYGNEFMADLQNFIFSTTTTDDFTGAAVVMGEINGAAVDTRTALQELFMKSNNVKLIDALNQVIGFVQSVGSNPERQKSFQKLITGVVAQQIERASPDLLAAVAPALQKASDSSTTIEGFLSVLQSLSLTQPTNNLLSAVLTASYVDMTNKMFTPDIATEAIIKMPAQQRTDEQQKIYDDFMARKQAWKSNNTNYIIRLIGALNPQSYLGGEKISLDEVIRLKLSTKWLEKKDSIPFQDWLETQPIYQTLTKLKNFFVPDKITENTLHQKLFNYLEEKAIAPSDPDFFTRIDFDNFVEENLTDFGLEEVEGRAKEAVAAVMQLAFHNAFTSETSGRIRDVKAAAFVMAQSYGVTEFFADSISDIAGAFTDGLNNLSRHNWLANAKMAHVLQAHQAQSLLPLLMSPSERQPEIVDSILARYNEYKDKKVIDPFFDYITTDKNFSNLVSLLNLEPKYGISYEAVKAVQRVAMSRLTNLIALQFNRTINTMDSSKAIFTIAKSSANRDPADPDEPQGEALTFANMQSMVLNSLQNDQSVATSYFNTETVKTMALPLLKDINVQMGEILKAAKAVISSEEGSDNALLGAISGWATNLPTFGTEFNFNAKQTIGLWDTENINNHEAVLREARLTFEALQGVHEIVKLPKTLEELKRILKVSGAQGIAKLIAQELGTADMQSAATYILNIFQASDRDGSAYHNALANATFKMKREQNLLGQRLNDMQKTLYTLVPPQYKKMIPTTSRFFKLYINKDGGFIDVNLNMLAMFASADNQQRTEILGEWAKRNSSIAGSVKDVIAHRDVILAKFDELFVQPNKEGWDAYTKARNEILDGLWEYSNALSLSRTGKPAAKRKYFTPTFYTNRTDVENGAMRSSSRTGAETRITNEINEAEDLDSLITDDLYALELYGQGLIEDLYMESPRRSVRQAFELRNVLSRDIYARLLNGLSSNQKEQIYNEVQKTMDETLGWALKDTVISISNKTLELAQKNSRFSGMMSRVFISTVGTWLKNFSSWFLVRPLLTEKERASLITPLGDLKDRYKRLAVTAKEAFVDTVRPDAYISRAVGEQEPVKVVRGFTKFNTLTANLTVGTSDSFIVRSVLKAVLKANPELDDDAILTRMTNIVALTQTGGSSFYKSRFLLDSINKAGTSLNTQQSKTYNLLRILGRQERLRGNFRAATKIGFFTAMSASSYVVLNNFRPSMLIAAALGVPIPALIIGNVYQIINAFAPLISRRIAQGGVQTYNIGSSITKGSLPLVNAVWSAITGNVPAVSFSLATAARSMVNYVIANYSENSQADSLSINDYDLIENKFATEFSSVLNRDDARKMAKTTVETIALQQKMQEETFQTPEEQDADL